MFSLELPTMSTEDKLKDPFRKSELVFEQGEEVKVALGEDEMLKLATGEKSRIKCNGFSFRIKNGMILGKSSDVQLEGSTSYHCYRPKCKNQPLVQKPWCDEHAKLKKKKEGKCEQNKEESTGEDENMEVDMTGKEKNEEDAKEDQKEESTEEEEKEEEPEKVEEMEKSGSKETPNGVSQCGSAPSFKKRIEAGWGSGSDETGSLNGDIDLDDDLNELFS